MENIISLETDRLLLRPFQPSDAYAASYNSRRPSVAGEMSDMILENEEAALAWINWINNVSNIEDPWQVLAIELKQNRTCIGLVGVIPQKKINGEVEILYSIADEYQKNGYATEAASALSKWFFESRENAYLCAIVKVINKESQRVVEKLGFQYIEQREIIYDSKPTMFKYYRLEVV